ncbi:UNVERIFIED_CONTAM: hypothetical protein HDU68_000047 [Siphonaria sp. JEL0065]|nr:hypothetical protein HDU68_000047 [Siphonaria sp. JEL0065]
MFSIKFLSKNDKDSSGMGVVWIAGTVASGHGHGKTGLSGAMRRLTKKDVAGVDLSKVCAFLVAPPQPMALRLTSNLMYGASRVLSNQMAFLHADANNVSVRLKKVFSEANSGASITMLATEASAATITLNIGDENDILLDEAFVDRSIGKERQLGWFASDSDIRRKNRAPDDQSTLGSASLDSHDIVASLGGASQGGASSSNNSQHLLLDQETNTPSLLSLPRNPNNRSLNANISIPSSGVVSRPGAGLGVGGVAGSAGSRSIASGNRSMDFGIGIGSNNNGRGGGSIGGNALFDYFGADDLDISVENAVGGNGEGANHEYADQEFEAYGGDFGANNNDGNGGRDDGTLDFNFFQDDPIPDLLPGPIVDENGNPFINDSNVSGSGRKRGRDELEHDGGEFFFEGEDASFGEIRRTSFGSSVNSKTPSSAGTSSANSSTTKRRRKAKKSFIDSKIELASKDMGVVLRTKQSEMLSLLEKENAQKIFDAKMKALVSTSLNRFSFSYGPLLRKFYTDNNKDVLGISRAPATVTIAKQKRAYKRRNPAAGAGAAAREHNENLDPIIDDHEGNHQQHQYQRAEEDFDSYNVNNNDYEQDAFPDLAPENNNSNNSRSNNSIQDLVDDDIELGVAGGGSGGDESSASMSRVSMPWAVRSISLSQGGARSRVASGSVRGSAVLLGSEGHSFLDEEVRKAPGSVRSSSGRSVGVGWGSFGGGAGDDWSAGDDRSNDVLLMGSLIYLNELVSGLKSRTASSQSFYHVLYLLTSNEVSVIQSRPFADIKVVFHDGGVDVGSSSSSSRSSVGGSGASFGGRRGVASQSSEGRWNGGEEEND